VRSDDPKRNLGWTNVYPTKALFPMMALTLRVRDSNLSQFKQPVLVFYSEQDQVVDPEMIKHAFASMSNASNQLFRIEDSESDNQHVLVGDIYAPKSVEPMVNHIVKWLPTISTPSTVLSRPRLSQ
jgi:esterase/lipase